MEISVFDIQRGSNIIPQDLVDEDFTLIVDRAKAFAFKVDDIEKSHAHHNWMDLASNRAAYRMKDNLDQEILGYIAGYKQVANHAVASTARTAADLPGTKAITTAGNDELLTVNKLKKGDFGNITTASAGDHSIPLAPRLSGETTLPTAYASPIMLLNRAARLQNVPTDGRWAVVSPIFVEMLRDEGSRMLNADFGESGALRNGRVTNTPIQGFRLYVSNNLPSIGTGPGTVGTANQNSNFGVLIMGHDSAVAMAQQITKTETFRDPNGFADIVRGMQVYGRKILRPEGVVTVKYNVA